MHNSEPLSVRNGISSFIRVEEQSAFYEDDYLKIHPDLHASDIDSKSLDVIRALQSRPLSELEKIKTICDIGSGSGLVMQQVVDWLSAKFNKKYNLISVDISMSILNKINLKSQKLTKIQADAAKLPLNDNTVDLVLLVDIIEHTKDPMAVINEAVRVGKYCVIKTPIEKSLYTNLNGGKARLQKMETKFGHIQHFSINDFKKLVRNKKVLYEEYDIIPNRWVGVDLLQKLLIKYHFGWLYGHVFGGFKVCLLTR